jgi:hypothetical protein
MINPFGGAMRQNEADQHQLGTEESESPWPDSVEGTPCPPTEPFILEWHWSLVIGVEWWYWSRKDLATLSKG